jgi:hypothetical protein
MTLLGRGSTAGAASAAGAAGRGALAAIAASSAAVSGRYFEASAVTVERSCVSVNGLLRKWSAPALLARASIA